MKLGIIGGWGLIGRALTEGVLAAGIVDVGGLLVSGRVARPQGMPREIRYLTDNEKVIEESDVVLLSVRPEQFAQMDLRASSRLVISVMAAVPTIAIAHRMGTSRVVRAMPSAAVSIGQSFTPVFAEAAVPDDDIQLARDIFATVGQVVDVAAEGQLDYMTGLTGSGPGIVALLAQAMQAHAVAFGLDNRLARDAIRATMSAAGEMLGHGAMSFEEITENLRSYRGTTAAAFAAMESAGFITAVGKGLEAAENRLRSMFPSAAL